MSLCSLSAICFAEFGLIVHKKLIFKVTFPILTSLVLDITVLVPLYQTTLKKGHSKKLKTDLS